MELAWIDIVDSAVKIGLGAAVTAIGTLIITKKNHEADRRKELRKHKLDVIEDVSVKAENYFSTYLRLRNKVAGFVKTYNHSEELPTAEVNKTVMDALRALDSDLMTILEERRYCEAKLKLLGQKEAALHLYNSNSVISDLRQKLFFDNVIPTKEFLEENLKQFGIHKKLYEEKLAAFYATL